MRSLSRDGHDPDWAFREMSPVDEMAARIERRPFDADSGRDGFDTDT